MIRHTATETRVAYHNSTWRAMNTGCINSHQGDILKRENTSVNVATRAHAPTYQTLGTCRRRPPKDGPLCGHIRPEDIARLAKSNAKEEEGATVQFTSRWYLCARESHIRPEDIARLAKSNEEEEERKNKKKKKKKKLRFEQ